MSKQTITVESLEAQVAALRAEKASIRPVIAATRHREAIGAGVVAVKNGGVFAGRYLKTLIVGHETESQKLERLAKELQQLKEA